MTTANAAPVGWTRSTETRQHRIFQITLPFNWALMCFVNKNGFRLEVRRYYLIVNPIEVYPEPIENLRCVEREMNHLEHAPRYRRGMR